VDALSAISEVGAEVIREKTHVSQERHSLPENKQRDIFTHGSSKYRAIADTERVALSQFMKNILDVGICVLKDYQWYGDIWAYFVRMPVPPTYFYTHPDRPRTDFYGTLDFEMLRDRPSPVISLIYFNLQHTVPSWSGRITPKGAVISRKNISRDRANEYISQASDFFLDVLIIPYIETNYHPKSGRPSTYQHYLLTPALIAAKARLIMGKETLFDIRAGRDSERMYFRIASRSDPRWRPGEPLPIVKLMDTIPWDTFPDWPALDF
jgi:hypothetical protein